MGWAQHGWATASPPPFYNFAVVPHISSLEQHWEDKETGRANSRPEHYEDIHMPRNTGAGVIISAFGLLLCFGLVWHMWLLSIVGLVGIVGTFLVRAYDQDVDYYVPAAEVARIECAHQTQLEEVA